jgi:hypothetical protein
MFLITLAFIGIIWIFSSLVGQKKSGTIENPSVLSEITDVNKHVVAVSDRVTSK